MQQVPSSFLYSGRRAACFVPGLAAAALVAGTGPRPETQQQTSRLRPRSGAERAVPDTLRHRVRASEVWILALPERPTARYDLVRTPAQRGLVDRSFFCRTLAEDTGEHDALVAASYAGAAADTLVLRSRGE